MMHTHVNKKIENVCATSEVVQSKYAKSTLNHYLNSFKVVQLLLILL